MPFPSRRFGKGVLERGGRDEDPMSTAKSFFGDAISQLLSFFEESRKDVI